LSGQVADHIFVIDPWWNPAAELQAIDRVHRIGQTKPVKAIRFIIKDSIEERIVQLQDKKKLVIAGALDGDTAAMGQLSPQVTPFQPLHLFRLICACTVSSVCGLTLSHPHTLTLFCAHTHLIVFVCNFPNASGSTCAMPQDLRFLFTR
jgi:hypothetical protein